MRKLLIELIEEADWKVALLDPEEEVSPKELALEIPPLDDRELVELWEEAERTVSLARRVRDAVGERINDQVRLPVRDGERWYSYGGYRKKKVIDTQRLIEYLGDRWPEVIAIDRIRVTNLEEVAVSKGDDPKTVRSTFLDESWEGTPRLKAGPVDKIPKRMKVNALGDTYDG